MIDDVLFNRESKNYDIQVFVNVVVLVFCEYLIIQFFIFIFKYYLNKKQNIVVKKKFVSHIYCIPHQMYILMH